MNSLALFTIALSSLVSSAVTETLIPGPRPTIGPVIPDQCICPGKVLCCKEVVDSSTRLGHYYLGQLGVEISGTSVPVGISCKPYDRFTADVKCENLVCCFDAQKPEVAAVGCVKVPQ